MPKPIYVLNGPNLNMLGRREADVYGTVTLDDIEKQCAEAAKAVGGTIDFRQTNLEGELIGWIQEAGTKADGLVLNAAAYTHTSIGILDALKTLSIPVVEVHLSNVFKRETFRHVSFVSPAATGVIAGLGAYGYTLALDAILRGKLATTGESSSKST